MLILWKDFSSLPELELERSLKLAMTANICVRR